MKNIISVDIGGTNSRFAHFTLDDRGALSFVNKLLLKTAETSSLDDLVGKARQEGSVASPEIWDAAVFAVPGAVKGGTWAQLANVSWAVDISGIKKRFPDRKIFLINDFVAQAYACPLEGQIQKEVIQAGHREEGATMAVIGAGTGLGHCALVTDDRGRLTAIPSEAGHAGFSFTGKTEIAYQEYLLKRTGASYPYGDLVVSGPGLSHLHAFLTGRELAPEEVVREIAPDSETTVLFARFYARACRNYTLTVLALGGIFIAGGVAMKNPFLVTNDHFRKEFTDSAHYGMILEKVPIRLMMSEDSGLWGAANFGAVNIKWQK